MYFDETNMIMLNYVKAWRLVYFELDNAYLHPADTQFIMLWADSS